MSPCCSARLDIDYPRMIPVFFYDKNKSPQAHQASGEIFNWSMDET
jgi:hypothetical protein